jgi:hypothetical protein
MADRYPIIQSPLPINAPVQNFSQFPYLAFFLTPPGEVACRRKNTRYEYGSINCRQFTLLGSAAGLHVQEMVVETFVSRGIRLWTLMAGMKEPQKRQSPVDCLRS